MTTIPSRLVLIGMALIGLLVGGMLVVLSWLVWDSLRLTLGIHVAKTWDTVQELLEVGVIWVYVLRAIWSHAIHVCEGVGLRRAWVAASPLVLLVLLLVVSALNKVIVILLLRS